MNGDLELKSKFANEQWERLFRLHNNATVAIIVRRCSVLS